MNYIDNNNFLLVNNQNNWNNNLPNNFSPKMILPNQNYIQDKNLINNSYLNNNNEMMINRNIMLDKYNSNQMINPNNNLYNPNVIMNNPNNINGNYMINNDLNNFNKNQIGYNSLNNINTNQNFNTITQIDNNKLALNNSIQNINWNNNLNLESPNLMINNNEYDQYLNLQKINSYPNWPKYILVNDKQFLTNNFNNNENWDYVIPINDQNNQNMIQRVTNSISEKLDTIDSIFIKKNINKIKKNIGRNNKIYEIYYNISKNSNDKLFDIKEKTNCCNRNFLSFNCSNICLNFYYMNEEKKIINNLILTKNNKFSTLCFNMPEMIFYLIENYKKNTIGKILNKWKLCNYLYIVYDELNKPKFKINLNYCKCNCLCFFCPPLKVSKNKFLILRNYETEEIILNIKKNKFSNINESVYNNENYFIPFKRNLSWKDKLLIICSIIFIDFQISKN